jgi:hypothetical protein
MGFSCVNGEYYFWKITVEGENKLRKSIDRFLYLSLDNNEM